MSDIYADVARLREELAGAVPDWAERLFEQRDNAIAAVARVRALIERTQRYLDENSEPGDPLTGTVRLDALRRALDGEAT